MQTNNFFWIELFEIELFGKLTVCKQMTLVHWILSDSLYKELFNFVDLRKLNCEK